MTKHFIYCRKSTEEEERQILSIEAQLTELRQFARQAGLLVVKEFTESKTTKEPGRPIFNQMMTEFEKGEAAGIIAWNPDRLARNSVDGGRIIYLVDRACCTNVIASERSERGNPCSCGDCFGCVVFASQ